MNSPYYGFKKKWTGITRAAQNQKQNKKKDFSERKVCIVSRKQATSGQYHNIFSYGPSNQPSGTFCCRTALFCTTGIEELYWSCKPNTHWPAEVLPSLKYLQLCSALHLQPVRKRPCRGQFWPAQQPQQPGAPAPLPRGLHQLQSARACIAGRPWPQCQPQQPEAPPPLPFDLDGLPRARAWLSHCSWPRCQLQQPAAPAPLHCGLHLQHHARVCIAGCCGPPH
mmetsp:Transcript_19912/g.31305  ORF Transcript_19912/g.31305 Transcript_19912/m.31305 type:complete len:224 (+) Transcript_19912:149-820(+)